MKSSLPTNNDIKKIMLKRQRRKNVIPEHAAATSVLNDEILNLYHIMSEATSAARLKEHDAKLRDLLDQKRVAETNLIDKLRSQLEDYILAPPKTVRIRTVHNKDRRVITWNKRRSTLLLFDELCALKLKQSFRVSFYGRDQLIRILIDALIGTESQRKSSQRCIIRIDIKNFYGSINRQTLSEKLKNHAGVPGYVIEHFSRISNAMSRFDSEFGQRGIPNGIGSSAILSEIYLEDLDREVQKHPPVAVYLRYNDDILVVCEPGREAETEQLIKDKLQELDLEVSSDSSKHAVVNHPNSRETSIEYLGYRFEFDAECNHLATIDISTKKYNRLVNAVDRVCDYIEQTECVAHSTRVNMIVSSIEYLFVPHYSDPGAGATRIISGLAYSAKFLLMSTKNPEQLDQFIIYSKQNILPTLASKVSKSGGTLHCKCCAVPAFDNHDVISTASSLMDQDSILSGPARQHIDEGDRRRVRELLWK